MLQLAASSLSPNSECASGGKQLPVSETNRKLVVSFVRCVQRTLGGTLLMCICHRCLIHVYSMQAPLFLSIGILRQSSAL